MNVKTIVHNCIAMDCVAPEYREIKSAFARGAVDWCFTVGETVFDDERACFSFDTWDRAEALYDGSIEALSAMFPAVIFHCREWAADAAEPDEPSQVWCAGQNVTALTKEQRVVFRDRAFVEYCKRFLRYERTAGEDYSYKARVVEGEERGAAAWGENRFGECEVYYWDSIKSLGCGDFHTVAARSDGRTVATGSNANGQCNVEGFRNADSIHCGRYHTAALKKVGTVLLASNDERFAQCAPA